MELADLVAHLDAHLRLRELPDYANAVNGLQLTNRSGRVTRVAAAVDATLPVVRQAIEQQAGLAIYSAHLPLDAHPQLGNNARLAAALGLEPDGGFLNYKGLDVGLTCTTELPREELIARFTQALGGGRVHVCPGGPAVCRRIGLSTGGSGSEVAAAAAAGIDTFLTGEGPHWSYTLAEELGINVLYGGHYATETFGVKALAADLEQRFGLPWGFVDHPTGL